jgi:hypothetical protein
VIKQGANMAKFDSDSFKSSAPDANLAPPLQALWWLRKGGLLMGPEWQKAHTICQQDEGNPSYDIVHALAHWIEGDEANAAYWYRRAGGQKAETIEAEWERVLKVLG